MSTREIDALVAEKVMGDASRYYLRRFSSDPYASKQLRDKMRAEGCAYGLECHDNEDGPPAYTMIILLPSGSQVHADGDTEEMAVVLAALKAKGVEL